MKHDKLYTDLDPKLGSFAFDAKVVDVFDDMIQRSVPFYDSLQGLIVTLVARYVTKKGIFYDLGCSTGQSLLRCFQEGIIDGVSVIGVDSSAAMLAKAKDRLFAFSSKLELKQHDLNLDFSFKPASLVLLNLTLQFLAPDVRGQLLAQIYKCLLPGSILILVEKVTFDSLDVDHFFRDAYFAYKQGQGYSKIELIRKEKALKSVLRPLSIGGNTAMLERAGFEQVHSFFQYLQFWGCYAIK
eukprot:COSAG01_NODE_713_length_14097_cov_15.136448_2_plen_241_part_00